MLVRAVKGPNVVIVIVIRPVSDLLKFITATNTPPGGLGVLLNYLCPTQTFALLLMHAARTRTKQHRRQEKRRVVNAIIYKAGTTTD